MSPDAVLIRFPDGTKEWRYGEKEIALGDRVLHDGKHYRIVELDRESEHLLARAEIEEPTD